MRINKTEIEQKSLQVRQEHNIQTYGVKDIFSLIAQRGIDLIRYPFGKDRLLGFATCFAGRKIIVTNSSEILSREIYTIAHELGHVLYDIGCEHNEIKIDFQIAGNGEDISEDRAYHFANCFLLPEEELRKYIRYELGKINQELNALDIIRMQLEFQVSYAAAVVRLHEIGTITARHKNVLFNKRDDMTSSVLFKKLDAEERLLKPADVIEIPPRYLEYVTSNYENKYIPYTSLEKALALIGMEASPFKKDEQVRGELDIEDIFGEYGK